MLSKIEAFLIKVKNKTERMKLELTESLMDSSNVPIVESHLVGSTYKHHSGNYYELLHIANEHTTNPKFISTAVYKCKGTGVVYSRPWEEFQSKFTLIKQ